MSALKETRLAPKEISGNGFTLRPFLEKDISERYLSWLNDAEVNRFLEVRHIKQTRATTQDFVRLFYGGLEKYIWGIYPDGSTEPIGTTTLYHIDRHQGSVELGLLIGDKAYWGKQAAVSVIKLVARFAFHDLGLRRMTGGTYAPHHGMNFLYKLLGFRQEGKMIQALQLTPGVYVDGYRWGILAEEWKAKHGD